MIPGKLYILCFPEPNHRESDYVLCWFWDKTQERSRHVAQAPSKTGIENYVFSHAGDIFMFMGTEEATEDYYEGSLNPMKFHLFLNARGRFVHFEHGVEENLGKYLKKVENVGPG